MNSFYSVGELAELSFKAVGNNVYISKKASIYGSDKIIIGSNVRIDDFCILSGNITIGDNVHIAAGTYLYGGDAGITICDFANISSRNAIYAVSDDYSGVTMSNPMIPDEYKNVFERQVIIGKHVIIGSGCTILPGVTIPEGVALGAMSLVKSDLEEWFIYAGVPAKKIKKRSKELLLLENQFISKEKLDGKYNVNL